MRSLPRLLILLLGLLAVRLVDDEGEQACRLRRDVADIWLMGPLSLIQEGIDTRLRWINGAEGWRWSVVTRCERPGVLGQGNPLGCMGEGVGPPLRAAMVTSPPAVMARQGPQWIGARGAAAQAG